ncbi:MAG: benzoate-CoA ligase family protein [Actinobacteria bacterium]|nr:benzoate-CoA ligase family protein [Actinomycetota bacterium]
MTTGVTAHLDTFARDRLPAPEMQPRFRFDLAGLSYPERLNAGTALLDEALSELGERPCVHLDDGVWSYADLAERSNRIARVLVEDMGLAPGNRVLLRAANTPELIACWFAILKAGGVVVATMPLLRAGELEKVIERAQVSHALTDARLTEELEEARGRQPVLEQVMSFGPGGELEQRLGGKAADFDPVETMSDDVALIAFTSGTTGQPKGCVHFHRDILAVCDTYARHILAPTSDDVFTGTPPLAFTFGLGGLVLFPMRFGASTVPIERPSPEALLEAIGRRGITTLFTAPTAYRALLREPGLAGLKTLRTCVAAGETLPAATSEAWFEQTGIRILDGIGSTEMLHIFISASADRVKPGSTGLPVPGYEARVVGEAMETLVAGEVGRLAVRGPTGCRYLADERQAEYVVDGWNLTGDAYLVDEDGYFWFQARADDMIVSSGYNISAPEVEAALLTHPAVVECAVVASPDPERGAVVKAFVVAAEDADPGPALAGELQAHVKATIAPYKYPRQVEFLDTLPKTATGKIQRYRLRQLEDGPPPATAQDAA